MTKKVGKINIKKGDTVKVIAGKDKGAEGKVIKVLREEDRVIVEGVNRVKRHTKVVNQGGRSGSTGGIITVEAPIHVSNVMLVDGDGVTRDDEDRAREAAERAAREVADVEGRTAAEQAVTSGHRERLAATGHAEAELEALELAEAEARSQVVLLRSAAAGLGSATEAIEASASPRKPSVFTFSSSASEAILDVA